MTTTRRPARTCLRLLAASVSLGAPFSAAAHIFSQPYMLPVPFALYAAGASAALVLSFLVVGVLAAAPRAFDAASGAVGPAQVGPAPAGASGWLRAGRAAAVGLLLLCILSGLAGTQDAYANFNMTFFWIVFVLGVPYAVAIAGDFYAAINPWKALVRALERLSGTSFAGRFAYPERLGCVPALVFYIAFIWLELFGHLRPRGLSAALLVYTLVNVAGAWSFGIEAWFRHGEFFGVQIRWIGRMSPRRRPWDGAAPGARDGPAWRWPFAGLLEQPAAGLGELLFLLFMLSSTAFDGLHATLPWATFYWRDLHPLVLAVLAPAANPSPTLATDAWYAWQWLGLALSPFVYLGLFMACAGLARAATGSRDGVLRLALAFAPSLLPIAFVYHVTHYYTLLLAQGGQLWRIVSDPLGRGWNLFGTASHAVRPWMLDVPTVWHTQIALIVAGHIAGVWVAHMEALNRFASPRRAAASQVPMLLLMMAFTTLGLWILSLPLSGA